MSSSSYSKRPHGAPKDDRQRVESNNERANQLQESKRGLVIWSALLIGVIVASIFAVVANFVL